MAKKNMTWARQSNLAIRQATRLPVFAGAFLMLVLSGFIAHAAAPVVTLPPVVTMPEDETTNLVFSVTDADSQLFAVTITARSSNTDLIPDAGLVLSGSSGTRILAIAPGLHKSGSATITMIATDDALESSTNTFTLNVTFTNYPPTFSLTVANLSLREDAGSANIPLAIADIETAVSSLTVAATSTNTALVPNGSLVFSGTNASRTLSFTSVTNLFGTSLISIVVTDGGGATATNNFLLTVLSVNDAPVFSVSTNRIDQIEDAGLTTVSNYLTGISSGPANESSQSNWLALSYTTNFFSQSPAISIDGTLTFQVATNANGTNTIKFILADNGGTANVGQDRTTNTLTLAVASVNDLPLIRTNISNLTINEDAGRTNLSYSIYDADHALADLTITTTSTNTSLVATNGFVFTGTSSNRTAGITALTNAFGTTEISLVVTDPAGGKATNTFVLTVNSVLDAPTMGGAINRTYLEDAATNLTGVISLYDGDTAITNVAVTVSSSDTNLVGVVISQTNSVSTNSLSLTLDYALKTNANGSATITLIADDGARTATNRFVLTVTAVNDAPGFTLSTNLVAASEDAGLVTKASFLTSRSAGPTNESAQTWAFTVTSGTNFGYATAPAISTNGTLTFRTATNAVGTNIITVVMKDTGGTVNGGKDSLTNTFSIEVTAANDAPYFTGLTARTILEEATTNNTAVVNVIDSDTARASVVVTATSSNTNLATVAITATNAVGTTNSALTLTFTPQTNANGSATITLIADDGALSKTNSFVLTVTAVNDAPGFTLSTNLVAATEDAGLVTKASFLTSRSAGPANESAQTWAFIVTSGTNFGYAKAPAISTNGTLTFRTATNAVGTNTITVVMKDTGGTANGGKDSLTNTFSIEVTAANDAPYFTGLTARTILEDATTNKTAVVNVIDSDTARDGVTVTATSSNTNLATVAITATNAVGTTNSALTLTFTPTTNANGSATITLVADDGALSKTNSFVLTVTAVNDAPSFTLSTNLVTATEDGGLVTKASFLTSRSSGPSNESAQTWAYIVTSGTNFGYAKAPAISTNGTLTFRTATNAVGTNTITVVMKDTGGTANGGKDSLTNTFSIEVTAANDAPYFTGLTARTILEDATTNKTAVINVIDPDTARDSVTVTATSSNTNLATVAITATNAVGTTNSALTLTFTPKANAFGSATITLIADDGALSKTNSFVLTVTPVNDAPSFSLGAGTNRFYLSSNNREPWGSMANSNVMDQAFGTNGWSKLYFETADTNELFRSGTAFIFMDGSDSGALEMGAFLTNHQAVLEDWVAAGGAVFINAAPNEGANQSLGFGVTLTFPGDATNGVAAAPAHAIFQGPFTPTGTSWSGGQFAHASVSGAGLTTLITNSAGSALLAEKAHGSGIALFGGMTTTNYHQPLVEAGNLRANILTYAAGQNIHGAGGIVLVPEDAGLQTNRSFLTNIKAGPTNESAQTWAFTVTSGTNFGYATAPAISTSGHLTFRTAPNAIGTNTVTVVMKDSGGRSSGGKDSRTNTFTIAVTPVNDAPYFKGLAAKTILEDATTNNTAVINVIDPDTARASVTVTATSSNTNLATVAITATNAVGTTNSALTLTFTPKTNAYGSATITLVADDGALTVTNSFVLTVTAVNDAPGFTLSTNLVVVAENAVTVTTAAFLTEISTGPTNEANQTWTFTVTSGKSFGYRIAPAISTNGTLTFRSSTNATGTNTITVVMKDTGGTSSGGRNAVTNTFSLVVTAVNDAPYFTGLTSKTILEDALTNNIKVINVIDPDTARASVTVTATSSDTDLATVAITATNAVGTTNSALTLTFTPKTNAYGTATITLVANDGALSKTSSFLLTVTAVNDAPGFNLAVSSLTVSKYNVAVSVANVITNLGKGAFNETNQTVSFVVSNSNSSLFTTQPAIGTNGTLTFTPAAKSGTVTVTVRAKDNAGVANGGVDTSAPLTFTITSPANPFAGLRGTYAGLFFDTNSLANDSSGYFRLVLATNGTFTGYILRAGSSNRFADQFSLTNPTVALPVSNSPCVLHMTLDTDTNWTESISGSVSNTTASWNVNLLAFLNVNTGGFPAARAGEYMVAIPGNANASVGPAGDGTLSIIVSNNGGVSVSGYLADDTFVKQSTHISRDGSVPFYAGLGAAGSASGWLNFQASGSSHLRADSEVVFIRGAGGTYYPSGFTNATVALGSLYDDTATDLLTMNSGTAVLSGGGLSTPITNTYTLANNILTIDPSATNGLSLTIFRASGQVSGAFTSGGQTSEINSIILQSTNMARGYFVRTNGVGSFLLY